MADAGASDLAGARDGLPVDGLLGAGDALVTPLGTDAASGLTIPDGGSGLADATATAIADATMTASDGGRSGIVDDSDHDAGAVGKSGASGCGCAVGGHDTDASPGMPLVFLGLFVLRRSSRPRKT
jgi:MYXO-CTERM domain-containing protein